jgi:hypothetical protein
MLATSFRRSAFVLAAALAGAVASVAAAQPVTLDLVKVGAPGNRATTLEEAPGLVDFRPIGAVAYEYRITRTEVTVAQWLSFVRAYAPHYSGAVNDSAFTGGWIVWNGSEYAAPAGSEGLGADPSWRFAARFINWLHNDQRHEREAFERGVYDTSTFGTRPDGTFTDQQRRSPGAKYWMPDIDEMAKATRYDPTRHGPGVDGYWVYGHSSDVAPVSGLPGQGGQTSAGLDFNTGPFYPALGSYSDTRSRGDCWRSREV